MASHLPHKSHKPSPHQHRRAVRDLDGAFDLLQTYGWIRPWQMKKPDGGGRPSQPFEVNLFVASFDDKTNETRRSGNDKGVLSVLSSVSAKPVSRPELPNADIDWLDESHLSR